MRGIRVACALSATVAVLGSLGPAAPASASNYGVELNGTYRMIMNGDWAKTNEVFMNEQTQVQTWTFSSSCESPIRCSGTVTSDQGWTAPMTNTGDYWLAVRDVPNWEPCPASYSYPGAEIYTGAGGTTAPAIQRFWFWGWDPSPASAAPRSGIYSQAEPGHRLRAVHAASTSHLSSRCRFGWSSSPNCRPSASDRQQVLPRLG